MPPTHSQASSHAGSQADLQPVSLHAAAGRQHQFSLIPFDLATRALLFPFLSLVERVEKGDHFTVSIKVTFIYIKGATYISIVIYFSFFHTTTCFIQSVLVV